MFSTCFPMISTRETRKIHVESPERKCLTLRIRGFPGMDPGLPKTEIPGKLLVSRFLRVSSRFTLLGNRFFARERYSFYSSLNQRLSNTFNDIVNSETFEFYSNYWRIQRDGWGLSGYRTN